MCESPHPPSLASGYEIRGRPVPLPHSKRITLSTCKYNEKIPNSKIYRFNPPSRGAKRRISGGKVRQDGARKGRPPRPGVRLSGFGGDRTRRRGTVRAERRCADVRRSVAASRGRDAAGGCLPFKAGKCGIRTPRGPAAPPPAAARYSRNARLRTLRRLRPGCPSAGRSPDSLAAGCPPRAPFRRLGPGFRQMKAARSPDGSAGGSRLVARGSCAGACRA